MKEAKIFQNGQSQAVRLPKEYRFSEKSVFVNKVGSVVMLMPKNLAWNIMFEAIAEFSPDFTETVAEQRKHVRAQKRKKAFDH